MYLCNISEDFVREVQFLLIYESSAFSFNNNLKKNKKPLTEELLKIDIHPQTFQRFISTKEMNKNTYFDIKLQFDFWNLTPKNQNILYSFHRKKRYSIILASNTEQMILGNENEPMSIFIENHIVDNATGKDAFQISVTGQTIISPYVSSIKEPFRVLLFGARAE